jgi:hypothetical protein
VYLLASIKYCLVLDYHVSPVLGRYVELLVAPTSYNDLGLLGETIKIQTSGTVGQFV